MTRLRPTLYYRILCGFIVYTFSSSIVLPSHVTAQVVLNLPAPGTMVTTSPAFTPALINGITIHPENPLEFDFIVGTGDEKLSGKAFEEESIRLIKYFLAALTVPEDEMWVNLSPHEKDRIIPSGFGTTEMGRDLLAQDYILKQLTASLMYPEKELGSAFWKNIYQKAKEQYGTTQIPFNTFNKVWIVPQEAVVYEHGNSAFVVKSRLKVMLEQDYVAMQKVSSEQSSSRDPSIHTMDMASPLKTKRVEGQYDEVSTQIIRKIIIPEIEKEVNVGQAFAKLRQIYNCVILAAWFKQNLKETLLGQVYVDKTKTKGVDVEDKEANQKIYALYLEAFKQGVYNYIKEDTDPLTQQVIPRKYFSGGTNLRVKGVIQTYGDNERLTPGDKATLASSPVSHDHHQNSVKVKLVELSPGAPVANEGLLANRPTASSPIASEVEENSRLAELARIFPQKVVTKVAAELIRLNLRGAYKKIVDINKKNKMTNDKKIKKTLRLLNKLLENTNQDKNIRRLVQLVKNNKKGEKITAYDLKEIKEGIIHASDGIAHQLFAKYFKEAGIILFLVSAGRIADGVSDSFRSNEMVIPDEIADEHVSIARAVHQRRERYYSPKTRKTYLIMPAIIDVIEGINSFVTNSNGEDLNTIDPSDAGSMTTFIGGPGLLSLGDLPETYAGEFVTNLGEHAEEFKKQTVTVNGTIYSLRDPELYVAHPKKILEYLEFLARIRKQRVEDLDEIIVLMDRPREQDLIAEIKKLQQRIPGLKIEGKDQKGIKAGIVPHNIKDMITPAMYQDLTGEIYWTHRTAITIGPTAQVFMMLALAGVFKYRGAVAGVRIYSGEMNTDGKGKVMLDKSQRYNWHSGELEKIKKSRERTGDAKPILLGTYAPKRPANGRRLFTEDDVGPISAANFAITTTTGVLRQEGGYLNSDTGEVTITSINLEKERGYGRPTLTLKKDTIASSPVSIDKEVGGINLSPELLDLQIKRDKNGVSLPLPLQPIEEWHIDGFMPIIINVTPVTNLPLLLGLAQTPPDTDEITPPVLKDRELEQVSAFN